MRDFMSNRPNESTKFLPSAGQTNVPNDLTNAIAIAAGIHYCLALKSDSRVVGWSYNVNAGSVTAAADLKDVVATYAEIDFESQPGN
jgi:hypothetical protein